MGASSTKVTKNFMKKVSEAYRFALRKAKMCGGSGSPSQRNTSIRYWLKVYHERQDGKGIRVVKTIN